MDLALKAFAPSPNKYIICEIKGNHYAKSYNY